MVISSSTLQTALGFYCKGVHCENHKNHNSTDFLIGIYIRVSYRIFCWGGDKNITQDYSCQHKGGLDHFLSRHRSAET